MAGFKYFRLAGLQTVEVELRGRAAGELLVADTPDGAPAAAIPVRLHTRQWTTLRAPCPLPDGDRALYFRYKGKGRLDFRAFTLRQHRTI